MRMTRAALKAQASDEALLMHEDPNDSVTEDGPSLAEDLLRPALRDITDEHNTSPEDIVQSPKEDPVAAKNSKDKKKARLTEKDKPTPSAEEETPTQTNTSSANTRGDHQTQTEVRVQHAANRDGLDELTIAEIERTETNTPAPFTTTSSTNEVTGTCNTPSRTIQAPTKTPKFIPELHTSSDTNDEQSQELEEDSFVKSIISRSPVKMEHESNASSATPDSFVEHIISRTPLKAAPRIEDSVAAIDALEDALEEMSDNLPNLGRLDVESPMKERKAAQKVITPARQAATPARTTNTPARKQITSTNSNGPTGVSSRSPTKLNSTSPAKAAVQSTKPAAPGVIHGRMPATKAQTKPLMASKPSSKPVSAKPKPVVTKVMPANPTPNPQPPGSNTLSKAMPNIVKKRQTSASLSTSKPGFVPAPSSKPTTKPTFALPGDAITAKLRAQREDRLKREEEAERVKKEFKARPAPSKASRPSVVPRDTKTSQARVSLMTSGSNKENVSPKRDSIDKKPIKAITMPKTRTSGPQANSSVRRMTSASLSSTSVSPRVSSLVSGNRSSMTNRDVSITKATGREIFGRHQAEMEHTEQEKRAKEEAAKKARADAAERGRQASREWAEKQKRRLTLQTAAKNGHATGTQRAEAVVV